MPVAILFVGVILTILIGVHVLTVALARTAVQSAADAAVGAAQVAGMGSGVGARELEGYMAAERYLAATQGSVSETRPPIVTVEAERGVVRAIVFGGVWTPVLGRVDVRAVACGPLDDIPAHEVAAADAWRC